MKKLSKDVYKRQVYQVMPLGLQVKGISVFPMHTACLLYTSNLKIIAEHLTLNIGS